MSPESPSINQQFNQQAQQIKEYILNIESQADAAWETIVKEGTSEARIDLGFDDLQPADASDIIDTRIKDSTPVISPYALDRVLPLSEESAQTTRTARRNVEQILEGDDDRLIAIVGPCSISDPGVALEYAQWVKEMRHEYGDTIEILMRAYFEKPRTDIGWKGYINDPELDNSRDMNLGIIKSRMIASKITRMGVPIAKERLNTTTPTYFNGFIAYDPIGARDTSAQKSREYLAGSSSPGGFKNTPEGGIDIAADAVVAANSSHVFLGNNTYGRNTQFTTIDEGNKYAHIILRGSKDGPNFGSTFIASAKKILNSRRLKKAPSVSEAIVVDASHANSGKDHTMQIEVVKDVAAQIGIGETAIRGVMIESNLVAGKQDFTAGVTDPKSLERGLSITDACSDTTETEQMLSILSLAVAERRSRLAG